MGEPLTDGQIIKLYISSGPAIKEVKMPNVVGMNYATAYQYLKNMGFENVEPRRVPSNETQDEVVKQSHKKDTMVDVTETIILDISEGPEETEEPTEETTEPTEATEETTEPTESTEPTEETKPTEETEPTEETDPTEATEPGPEVTVIHTISLPEREEAYTVSLYYNGQIIRQDEMIMPGQKSISVQLTGSGKKTYALYINGAFYQNFVVEFVENG
jgi:beta-lactam-binding protein with PASTA domain